MISLHLCCNDDHGNFAGEVGHVEFHDADGLVLDLELDPLHLGDWLPMRWADRDGLVAFENGDTVLWVKCKGHRRWVGSLFWDATAVDLADAIELAWFLLKAGFQVTEYVCAYPLRRFGAEVPL